MNQSAEKITNLKTELYSFHIANGGKMVPFAGYDMPVQYSEGIIKEHQHVRSAVGIFDVSHMGQFSIFGNENDYLALEQIVPIDLKSLKVNQSKYSVLMNNKGGIDDDLIITKSEEGINIVLNAACKHHDITRIHEVINPSKTKLHDNLSLIAIQGPKAVNILEVLVNGVKDLKFMTGGKFKYKDNDVYVNRSGYTGEDGFEVSLENSVVKDFCKTLLENEVVKLIGLGARDSLRLEAGLCLYGHDLNPDISPIEASLSWALSKMKKEKGNFLGSKVVKDQIENGVKKKRVGIKPDKIIAREGSKIFKDDKEIGVVTSGGFGPSVNGPVAMGYVLKEFANEGETLELEVRGKKHQGKVFKMPFYKKSYVK